MMGWGVLLTVIPLFYKCLPHAIDITVFSPIEYTQIFKSSAIILSFELFAAELAVFYRCGFGFIVHKIKTTLIVDSRIPFV